MTTNSDFTPIPCRSEPARDSGVSASTDIECAGLIASRLTPTGVMCTDSHTATSSVSALVLPKRRPRRSKYR
ncbi:hypothetical protein EJA71_09835 [Pseudomonas sp. PB106]|nr:hypothetical protein EJA71_09835 [Pseudomonas sp. PB106]